MKIHTFLFCFIVGTVASLAQNVVPLEREAEADSLCSVPLDVNEPLSVPLAFPSADPFFQMLAPGFDGCSPWFMGCYGPLWNLHEGVNAQLSMSVTAGLGKHAPSGVGFGQSGALAYALPLGKRFSLAAGVYAQHMDWGTYRNTDAGIAAILGFKVNERISLYAYGTKSFMPKKKVNDFGMYPFFMEQVRDRIGGMAEFKITDNFTFGISVERSTLSNPGYFLPTVPSVRKSHNIFSVE